MRACVFSRPPAAADDRPLDRACRTLFPFYAYVARPVRSGNHIRIRIASIERRRGDKARAGLGGLLQLMSVIGQQLLERGYVSLGFIRVSEYEVDTNLAVAPFLDRTDFRAIVGRDLVLP